MKKRNYLILILIVGIISFIFFFSVNTKEEPIVMQSNGIIEILTIDEQINQAEIIIIGKVENLLPSQWLVPENMDKNNATANDILKAGGLFTDSIIFIEQILKGDYKDTTVRVRSFVGENEIVRWVDDLQVSYKKDKIYLIFLRKDQGPSKVIDPGYYKPVNEITSVYEITEDRAVSVYDEWLLEDLIAYIQKVLSEPTQTPTELIPIETQTETPSVTITPEVIISDTITPTP